MTRTRTWTVALLALLMMGVTAMAQEEAGKSDKDENAKAAKTESGEQVATTEPAETEAEVAKIEKELLAAWEGYKSMAADMRIDATMNQMGRNMTMDASGRCEMMRKDDHELVRLELTQNIKMGEGEGAMQMQGKILSVDDGQYLWTLVEQMGQKRVIKARSGEQNIPQFGGKSMFDSLRSENKLKALPEETVDGKDVYVLEATPNETNPMMPVARNIMYFDKKTGALIKMVSKGKDDETLQTLVFENMKVNPELDPKDFTFEVPEGVQVMDQTGG